MDVPLRLPISKSSYVTMFIHYHIRLYTYVPMISHVSHDKSVYDHHISQLFHQISAWYLRIDSHTWRCLQIGYTKWRNHYHVFSILVCFHISMTKKWSPITIKSPPNGPSLCLILSKCLGVSSGNLTMSCGQRWMIYLLCLLSFCIGMLNWLRPKGKSNSQRAIITNDQVIKLIFMCLYH